MHITIYLIDLNQHLYWHRFALYSSYRLFYSHLLPALSVCHSFSVASGIEPNLISFRFYFDRFVQNILFFFFKSSVENLVGMYISVRCSQLVFAHNYEWRSPKWREPKSIFTIYYYIICVLSTCYTYTVIYTHVNRSHLSTLILELKSIFI